MKLKSTVINSILQDEYERNVRMERRYRKELDALPKGSVLLRNVSNNTYVYLKYREGGKVVSKYLGTADGVDVPDLQSKISRRREIQKLLKKISDEQDDLKKILGEQRATKSLLGNGESF